MNPENWLGSSHNVVHESDCDNYYYDNVISVTTSIVATTITMTVAIMLAMSISNGNIDCCYC